MNVNVNLTAKNKTRSKFVIIINVDESAKI